MNRKAIRWMGLFIAVLFTIGLSACSVKESNQQDSGSKTAAVTTEGQNQDSTNTEAAQNHIYKDKFGEVTVPVEPKKLLVIDTRYAEYLISMGIKPAMVAGVKSVEPEYRIDYFKDNGVEFIDYPQYEHNFELLLSLAPDMILVMGNSVEENVYEQLSQVAPTVALNAGPSMDESMPMLAQLFGKETEYEAVKAEYDSKAEQAKIALDKAIGDSTVLVLRADQKDYRALGQRAKMGSSKLFYDQLGLKIPERLANEEAWFTVISLEVLPEINPDYIFIENRQAANFNGNETMKTLEESSIWNSLKAVQSGKVFPLDTRDFVGGEGPIGYAKMIDYIVSSLTSEGSNQ